MLVIVHVDVGIFVFVFCTQVLTIWFFNLNVY